MLDHPYPCAGHGDGGHGGDVDGVSAVAAGPYDVDRVGGKVVLDPGGRTQHGLGEAGDLSRGLALGA